MQQTIKVMIDDWLMADGTVKPPAIHEQIRLPLLFVESNGVDGDPRVSWIDAVASRTSKAGIATANGRKYATRLHSQQWEAYWLAPEPLEGNIFLAGMFYVDDSRQCTPVTGEVMSVAIASRTLRYMDGEWVASTTSAVTLEEVQAADVHFNEDFDEFPPKAGSTRLSRVGVLVELLPDHSF